MSEHTPTPYYKAEWPDEKGRAVTKGGKEGNAIVCYVRDLADADFILRSCNAHGPQLDKTDAALLEDAAEKWVYHLADEMLQLADADDFEPDDYEWDLLAATARATGLDPHGTFPEPAWEHLDKALADHQAAEKGLVQ